MEKMNFALQYILHCWHYRKTKVGLAAVSLLFGYLWIVYVLPVAQLVETDVQQFVIYAAPLLILIFIYISWLYYSGRIVPRNPNFTVVFCLKPMDVQGEGHIRNALSMLKNNLDRVQLLEKIKVVEAGADMIGREQDAINYRAKNDIDLVIWGEVFSGGKGNDANEVSDFKNMSLTYKLPPEINMLNLQDIIKSKIGIGIVDRDWNIFEVNSINDTEKIAVQLSEIVMLILGLIYSQTKEFVEESIVILECLFNQLNAATKNQNVNINTSENTAQMSPEMLRKDRIHSILLDIYKNVGVYFTETSRHEEALFYLKKYLNYGKKDTNVLSSLAYSSYYIGDLRSAKSYTDDMCHLDKNSAIGVLNSAFFSILEKDYVKALSFYERVIGKRFYIDPAIVTRVIAFLDERKSENPDELAYDFAIGVLNRYHGQEKIGIDELKQFVKHAKDNVVYKELVDFVSQSKAQSKRKQGRKRKGKRKISK